MALYCSPDYQTIFQSIGLSIQEKKFNIGFQYGGHGAQLGFTVRTNLAIFYLPITSILPMKFGVKWPFGQGVEHKNRFLRWEAVGLILDF